MSETENLARCRQNYQATIDGNPHFFFDSIAEDIEWLDPNLPEELATGRLTDRESVIGAFKRIFDLLEFEEFRVDQILADGDTIVVLGYEQVKVRSTGRRFSNHWAHMHRWRDGKMVQYREYNDTAAIFQAFSPT